MIEAAFADYTSGVPEPLMVVSLKTAEYLYRLCIERQPRRILDLGSGFSSWLFRQYAERSEQTVEVVSVDSEQQWLDKSADYCRTRNGFMLWDTFCQTDSLFDLVFVDYAGGETRNAIMQAAVDRVAPLGCIVFDDMHDVTHQRAAVKACEWLVVRNITADTKDASGRFAMMAERTELTERFWDAAHTPSDIVEHLPRFVNITNELHAETVIELGTRGGVSTTAWLFGLTYTGGHLWTVDLQPAPYEAEGWTHLEGDDLDPEIFKQLPIADVLFIDTSHHYQHTLAELNLYINKVRSGGRILLHDTELARPEGWTRAQPLYPVKTAVAQFCAEEGLRWTNRENCFGLATIEVP